MKLTKLAISILAATLINGCSTTPERPALDIPPSDQPAENQKNIDTPELNGLYVQRNSNEELNIDLVLINEMGFSKNGTFSHTAWYLTNTKIISWRTDIDHNKYITDNIRMQDSGEIYNIDFDRWNDFVTTAIQNNDWGVEIFDYNIENSVFAQATLEKDTTTLTRITEKVLSAKRIISKLSSVTGNTDLLKQDHQDNPSFYHVIDNLLSKTSKVRFRNTTPNSPPSERILVGWEPHSKRRTYHFDSSKNTLFLLGDNSIRVSITHDPAANTYTIAPQRWGNQKVIVGNNSSTLLKEEEDTELHEKLDKLFSNIKHDRRTASHRRQKTPCVEPIPGYLPRSDTHGLGKNQYEIHPLGNTYKICEQGQQPRRKGHIVIKNDGRYVYFRRTQDPESPLLHLLKNPTINNGYGEPPLIKRRPANSPIHM